MLESSFLWYCRIAYQRNDDDEEEAARERRRRARQERLRQKQEEESLGQVTDQVEVNAQNRYCPLWDGEFLSCFSLSPSVWMGCSGQSLPFSAQLNSFQSSLFISWPFQQLPGSNSPTDFDTRTPLLLSHLMPQMNPDWTILFYYLVIFSCTQCSGL